MEGTDLLAFWKRHWSHCRSFISTGFVSSVCLKEVKREIMNVQVSGASAYGSCVLSHGNVLNGCQWMCPSEEQHTLWTYLHQYFWSTIIYQHKASAQHAKHYRPTLYMVSSSAGFTGHRCDMIPDTITFLHRGNVTAVQPRTVDNISGPENCLFLAHASWGMH